MARGLCPLAAPAIRHVEVGVISGAGGLIRPHPKPTPGDPQGFARLSGSRPGGVAQSHQKVVFLCFHIISLNFFDGLSENRL